MPDPQLLPVVHHALLQVLFLVDKGHKQVKGVQSSLGQLGKVQPGQAECRETATLPSGETDCICACRNERLYMGRMCTESEVLLQPGHKWEQHRVLQHTRGSRPTPTT